MIKWDKNKLEEQYKTMTLADIGKYYGVCGERVRQVMNEYGLSPTRRRKRIHPRQFRKYSSISDFLIRHSSEAKCDALTYIYKFLPEVIYCQECGAPTSGRRRHIHHIVYPARAVEDIQILCAQCHVIKHRGKISYVKQLDLYNDYKGGMIGRELATKYNISIPLVYKVVRKIKNGYRTLRG